MFEATPSNPGADQLEDLRALRWRHLHVSAAVDGEIRLGHRRRRIDLLLVRKLIVP
ncbi:hypothetical protein [Micromonospora sp. NPDC049274]|uniref:hypothetical protein n=1 Tax=Micromonospora sp. NPDC049274 TaxID=3154829 RepID=UPI00341C43B3